MARMPYPPIGLRLRGYGKDAIPSYWFEVAWVWQGCHTLLLVVVAWVWQGCHTLLLLLINPVAGGLLLCCAVLSRSSCSGCFAEVAYECYVEDECGVGCARRG